jgi:dipeptidyl aminopeptidase/acylaminoacyl peptidase
MTDLHARFRRLDRVRTPDLWYEAVGRATAVDAVRQPAFRVSPTLVLIALALLTAALAGAVTVGSWLNRPAPVPKVVTYENGMLVASEGCGAIVSIDPSSFATREVVPGQPGCEEEGGLTPAWSLNGERLAFIVQAERETPGGIWVYEAGNDAARQVATCHGWCSGVTISPDGSLVAYVDVGDQAPALFVTAVDSGETVHADLLGSPREPVFSPDGRRIALPLFGGRSGLYLVDVSRAAQGVIGTPYLLHGIVDASDAAWSPDGEWIAITQSGGFGLIRTQDNSQLNSENHLARMGIVAVRSDGSDVRALATGPAGAGPSVPTWSADSSTVAYMQLTPEGSGDGSGQALSVSTVGLDGADPTRIWESGCCVTGYSAPSWSPDGAWIAFSVGGTGRAIESGVVLVSPDGADARSSAGHPWVPIWEPVWQPIPKE